MKFIEMTGRVFAEVVNGTDERVVDLHEAGIEDDTIVRVNEHGDIEVRRTDRWDVVGGLIGNFDERLRQKTGLDWA
jgi:hypothetical protein